MEKIVKQEEEQQEENTEMQKREQLELALKNFNGYWIAIFCALKNDVHQILEHILMIYALPKKMY